MQGGLLELEPLGVLEHLALEGPEQGLLLVGDEEVVRLLEQLDLGGRGVDPLLAVPLEDVLDGLVDRGRA